MHSGGGPLPHSALVVGQAFEISCVDGYDDEDGCDVEVWQDLFRVDSRVWRVERMRSCVDS